MIKIYAYAGCDTCRRALKSLKERGVPHEVLPIREQPPTKAELKRMLAVYGGEVRKLFNTSGQDYKALGLAAKLPTMSAAAALDLLATNGNLVKRPFVTTADGGIVGFKREEWEARWGSGAAV
jgi:arsenate reductase